ncbi:MAG: YkgJ family cysteine cluster protein [Candidatus Altiarchaeales archaeon]|nr:YkgJ family cysteine cluster protein [Candidatus Altiarchaeales archaeon]
MSLKRCVGCTRCCRHVTLEIDAPEDEEDFENIRWYLLHQNVSVFKSDDEWYVEFHTPCRMLSEDGGCRVYEQRPKICSDYDPSECELNGQYWDVRFTCPEELSKYLGKQ